MKLQDQVCSLTQAKRLKELRVKQESLFSWCGDETMRLMDNGEDGVSYSNWVFVSQTYPVNNMQADHREDVPSAKPFASAYTVAELGIMLGKGTKATELHWQWLLDCVNSGLSGTVAYNPVALAGHIITQIETGTLPIEKINARL